MTLHGLTLFVLAAGQEVQLNEVAEDGWQSMEINISNKTEFLALT